MSVRVEITIPNFVQILIKLEKNPVINSEITDAWSLMYSVYIRQRFDKLSKGGSDDRGYSWPKLAQSTIDGRRKGREPKKVTYYEDGKKKKLTLKKPKGGGPLTAILRDTNMLFPALQAAFAGGGILQKDSYGVMSLEITFDGGEEYETGGPNPPTTADLAIFHDRGFPPHLPQRIILAIPSDRVLTAMAQVAKKILVRNFSGK